MVSVPPVYVEVLPIPDRVDRGRLRLCVQMTPTTAPSPGGGFALADWPSQVSRRTGAMRLVVARLVNGKPSVPYRTLVKPGDTFDLFPPDGDLVEVVCAKWKQIFDPGGQGHGFQALYNSLVPESRADMAVKMLADGALPPVAADTGRLDALLSETYRRAVSQGGGAALQDLDGGARGFGPKSGAGGVDGLLDARQWSDLATLLDFTKAAAKAKQVLAARPPFVAGETSAADIRAICREHLERGQDMPTCLQDLLSPASKAVRAAHVNAAQLAFGTFALAVGSDDEGPPPNALEPDETQVHDDEHPRRKLGAMLSFPTIAKYFSLCTDLVFDPDALDGVDQGVIAVELKRPDGTFPAQPDPASLRWTAFRYAKPPDRRTFYFGPWEGDDPASRPIHALEENRYRDGLVNLRQTLNQVPQFRLGDGGDVTNALMRLQEKAVRLAADYRSGARPMGEGAGLGERASRGVVLYHELAAERLAAQSADEAAAAAAGQKPINFIEHMVHGLRYDVLLEPRDDPPTPDRWRPLMARVVDYPDLDPRFMADARVAAVRYRDDAVAISPPAVVPIWVGGEPDTKTVPLNELMQWSGGSLAVAADDRVSDIDPAKDLAISIAFDLPDSEAAPTHCPPPFRFGRTYRLRARIGLPLGCGLTFEDVQGDPGTDDYTLPKDGGFLARRHEKLRAPEVLLPWDSPLVTAPDPVEVHARRDGRTLDQLVIRDSADDYASDARFIVPARTSLEDWERQGQLDFARYDSQPVPAGAFEADASLVLYGPDGSLPEARGGTITWYDPVNKIYKSEAGNLTTEKIGAMKPRGPVLVMDPRAAARQRSLYPDPAPDNRLGIPKPRYYPDGYSRAAIASLSPVPGYSAATGLRRIEFWKDGQHPSEATPVSLAIRRGKDSDTVKIGAVRHSAVRTPDGREVRVPTLTVTIPPAEMVDLLLYTEPRDSELAKAHFGVGAQAAEAADPKHARVRRQTVRRLNVNVQDRRTLRLVHAVRRPLKRPVLKAGDVRAVTVSVRAESSNASSPMTWSERVKAGNLASEEGGATTFFIGSVEAHRLSTGRLRCDVRWYDYGPTSIKLDPKNGRWRVEAPEDAASIFQIDTVGSAEKLAAVDLLWDEQHMPRALSYAFKDGRARQLRARLVATSRFTSFFPPSPKDSDVDGVGHFDRASGDFASAPSIWTECTFRPPPPIVDRVLPVLVWDEKRPGRYASERKSLLRVFLDPQWYASGEGEKLALVFDAKEQAVCDYQSEAMEPFGRFLTRWGRDPIRITDTVASLRPADVINGTQIDKDFDLYPGASEFGDKGAVAPHKVRIVALTPKVDPELGLYCDIEFGGEAFEEALQSYMPFVQLGLARYQEHAVKGLELSRPVEYTVQLIPNRRAVVKVTSARRIQVNLFGQIFAMSYAPQPYMHVRIMERYQETLAGGVPGESYWIPVLDFHGSVVEAEVALSKPNRPEDPIGSVELTVPKFVGSSAYGVLIEEFEMLPADPPEPETKDLSGKELLAGAVMTRRGPIFMATISLAHSA